MKKNVQTGKILDEYSEARAVRRLCEWMPQVDNGLYELC